MRFWCATFCAALFALSAQAKTLAEISDERACAEDSDCVVIEGVCGPTAVNKGYQNNAKDYYKKQSEGTKCPARFWQVKDRIAECKPRVGPKGKAASGSCTAVAKPQGEDNK